MGTRSRIIPLLLVAMLLPVGPQASVAAQTRPSLSASAVPDTPAGRHFSAWLEAFNSEDPAQIDEFLRRELPSHPFPPRGNQGMRGVTGGFSPVRVESASDGQITVLLEERD